MKSINARMNYLHIPMRSMCSQCHSSTEFFFLFWYRKNFVNNFSIYEMQISEGFLRIDLKRLFRYLKPPHAISNKKYLTVLFVSISIEGLHRNISVNETQNGYQTTWHVGLYYITEGPFPGKPKVWKTFFKERLNVKHLEGATIGSMACTVWF